MEWPIGKLKKYEGNPILSPVKKTDFESAAVYNGTAIKKAGKIYLLYRAEQYCHAGYISRICLAVSDDGVNFERYENNPMIVPEEDYEKRGCEDPRITEIEGTYYLLYTAFSGKEVNTCLATSKDLLHWEKKGIILKGFKSGVLLPKKIEGKFVLYFGDVNINIAYSKDLKDWEISEKPILTPRENDFDSRLVEMGPAPLITEKGIFIIYNSSDGVEYNVGYAMFSESDPEKLIARSDEPVLSAEHYWENFGKVNYVVFAEGLIEKDGNYYLYYGGADKGVGVAIGRKKD